MSKPVLHLDFSDFHLRMRKDDNFFTRILAQKYDVKISDKPDLLIFSDSGDMHRLHRCRKIFYTAEVFRPDFSAADYAMTFHHLDDARNLRVPNYVPRMEAGLLVKSAEELAGVSARRDRFCCFFTSYANAKTQFRLDFFEQLSRYKKVDSAGRWNHNISEIVPNDIPSKLAFLRQYKFYMVFENESLPGYTTEKLAEAMAARCLPIYWGSPEVAKDFNPKSFLNYHDFPSQQAFINRIIEVDKNDELYRQYLREPFFHGNKPNIYFDQQRILDFLSDAIDDQRPPVSTRGAWKYPGRWMLLKRYQPREKSAGVDEESLIKV